ncbi:DoxX family protein [Pedobacter sandarakinus]|uniref:DoxX family protein n=1 Tax=Pedobacter sandarakinus TaxID=353156 RepID=UPI002246F4B3|nr:MauE/DoxX family redox-associated membrane protein [Pedobacter sandarakinus]MCX2575800.1 DoxX family protein [Pedobacter sandarakinus]
MKITLENTFWYKISIWIYGLFYVAAGINHFISTAFYDGIMPPWLPYHNMLIVLSGVIEIALGLLLLFSRTRQVAAILIILMLIAFLPAHIYMIKMAPYMLGKVMVTAFVAWVRIPIQLMLIAWAWYYCRRK